MEKDSQKDLYEPSGECDLPFIMNEYQSLWLEVEFACDEVNYGTYRGWTGLERVLSPCNRDCDRTFGKIPIPFEFPRSDQEIVENEVFVSEYERVKSLEEHSEIDLKNIARQLPSIVAANMAMQRRKTSEHFCLRALYQGKTPAFLWNEITGELTKLPEKIWSTPQGEKAFNSHAPGLWSGETGTVLGEVDKMRVVVKANALTNIAFKSKQIDVPKFPKTPIDDIGYRAVIDILYWNAPSWINSDSWSHYGFIHKKGKSGSWTAKAFNAAENITMTPDNWIASIFDSRSGEATSEDGIVYSNILWDRNDIERDRKEFHETIEQHNLELKSSLVERISAYNCTKQKSNNITTSLNITAAKIPVDINCLERSPGKIITAADLMGWLVEKWPADKYAIPTSDRLQSMVLKRCGMTREPYRALRKTLPAEWRQEGKRALDHMPEQEWETFVDDLIQTNPRR